MPLILALAVAKKEAMPGVNNHLAYYDVDQAVAHLTVQAGALGLVVHQMGGFDVPRARELFEIPEGYDPLTVIAIGYQGKLDDLPDVLRERETETRTRNPLMDFVFEQRWNEPLALEAKTW